MSETRPVQKKRIAAVCLFFVLFFLVAAYLFLKNDRDPSSVSLSVPVTESSETEIEDPMMKVPQQAVPVVEQRLSAVVEKPIQKAPAIDFKDLKTGSDLDQVMEKRLRAAGITQSLDMIVRSDESFTVGDRTVSMPDILEKASAARQQIFETRITEFEGTAPERIDEYGIYVVRPGDNIWNIHFNILKEYYGSQGIPVAYDADEPLDTGHSSGVGKILKFSEIMVIIYNLIEEKIVTDIDLIEPMSKIVLYNMNQVFALLSEIRFDQIDQIQFDGRTIWVPVKEG